MSHERHLSSSLPLTCLRNRIGLWASFLILVFIVVGLRADDRDPVGIDAESKSETAKTATGTDQKLPAQISFNVHIRPIMSDTCFTCHGPDEDENQSSLRLDSFAAAVDDGGLIEPGDPESSSIYERLIDEDEPMPPEDFRHQLSDYDIALFRKWIEQGAKYESHWSYTPLTRPDVSAVSNASAVANDIDAFVMARLELEGFQPSRRADRATLLRRLSLDLIGLPPTTAELNAFLSDESTDAYQNQVERLLASPHYGERMASPWLDIVRFSDTVGYHGDQNQNVFPYRDYVIESLNKNKPFDQFTREQLAGDLLENPTDEQLIATALIRLNMMTREGGAQPGEYLAKYTADRVRMLGTAWMGLTTGCCECHNHKYDPLTAKDFYSLGAFFDDIRQWGVYSSYGYTPNPDLQGFSNDYPFPPEIRSLNPALLAQITSLENLLAKSISGLDPQPSPSLLESPQFREWAKNIAATIHDHDDAWIPVSVTDSTSAKNTKLKMLEDSSLLISGKPVADDTLTITASVANPINIKAFRLEAIPDEANHGFVGRLDDGRFSTTFSATIAAGKSTDSPPPLAIEFAQSDRNTPAKYSSGYPPRFLGETWQSGPTRWQLPIDEAKLNHTAVYHLSRPTPIGEKVQLVFKLNTSDLGRFRISVSPLTRFVAGMPAADTGLVDAITAHQSGTNLSDRQVDRLLSAYYLAVTPANQLPGNIKRLRDMIVDCRSGYAMTTIAQQSAPEKMRHSRILPRGNWQDETGDEAVPATPGFLPQLPDADSRRLTRLDLADWLISNENPLTARHYVNRTWKHFFGAGLSNKLDDLGNQGEWPSHPALLDWLAAEFRETWDMKHITRLIVNSNTYQQQVSLASQVSEIDPFNRLLSQQSPRRLEAETVRDNALAIAGLLNVDFIGGPSVFPYQPDGHYSNLQFPNRGYSASHYDLQYRRGVYIHWQRTFLHPMLVNFDAPSRDECTADRTQSNSPQQALTLLNDPQFVESGIAFANRLLTEHPDADFEARLDAAYLQALSRLPTENERSGVSEFFSQQKKYYAANQEDVEDLLNKNGSFHADRALHQVQLAAWSQVCRVILNLHETITRY